MANTSQAFNTDCLKEMKKYADNFFDLAVVDPPYGINAPNLKMGATKKNSSASVELKRNRLQRLNTGGGKLKDRILNTMPIDWDNSTPSKEYFDELFRVSKNQIIWGGNYFELPPSRCWLIWDKLQPWDNFSQFEMAWTSFDKPSKIFKCSNTGGTNSENKIHPTQKPVKLYNWIFKHFSKPNFKILDTHLGSGSSRISAYMFDLFFVAYETDNLYFNDQNYRFENFLTNYNLNPKLDLKII